ncbi:MAG TPA: MepB family protein, partial [Flavobacterium sp.]|nr:MepB family protein [Flavobacterium sp.]
MRMENTLSTPNTLPSDLAVVKELVYDKCGFHFSNFKQNDESADYGACSFELNGKKIQHRVSKITPTKKGQFVTLWKRNKDGVTAPFDLSDDIDFILITSKSGDHFGQFIFPKSVLATKGILTKNGKEGKRGIRVYPPWDIATSKQAEKTQNWQTTYFLTIKKDNTSELNLPKKLFTKTNEI